MRTKDVAPAPKAPSLAGALLCFTLLAAAVASAVLLFVIEDRAIRFETEVQQRALSVRTGSLILNLSRTLEREWVGLTAVAEAIPTASVERVGAMLDLAAETGGVSWAGFTGTDGIVIAASRDMLVGADMSGRNWFQRGLNGDFSGDVRETVLLAQLLLKNGEPPRVIDFAMPVRTESGRIIGVVTYYIDASWLQDVITRIASSLDLELFLLAQDGTVHLRVGPPIDAELDPEVSRMAATGHPQIFISTDHNGGRYLTAVVPALEFQGVPSFGWRLAARLPAQVPGSFHADAERGIGFVLLGIGSSMALATLLFIRIFLVPLHRLAKNASAIASGADLYPYESSSSREAAELSSALARLQSRQSTAQSGTAEERRRAAAASNREGRAVATPGAEPSV